ncbi:MAG: hypothetical protein V4677_17270 [Bacteroidota bacterium]
MKKIILSLFVTATGTLFAQYTAKDVFTSKSMVWYGLNFTEAKMVGMFDQAMGAGPATAADLKNKWIPNWNALIQGEQKNFKIAEAFQKDDIFYDVTPTDKANYAINTDEFMSYNHYTFADPQKSVAKALSNMQGGQKTEGIGVTFVVESFNKQQDKALVYVTIFDIKTKNILVLEKIGGKPMGIGLRNFWGGAIKHIIKQINEDYYRKWKSLAK